MLHFSHALRKITPCNFLCVYPQNSSIAYVIRKIVEVVTLCINTSLKFLHVKLPDEVCFSRTKRFSRRLNKLYNLSLHSAAH